MIIPDLNLLIYAYDARSPYHELARQWWENLVCGNQDVGLPDVVLIGFIRICTRKSIYQNPMSIDEAWSHVEQWLESPVIRVLYGSELHLRMTMRLLAGHGTAGNLTTDAQIASHAWMHEATIHSNDADFHLFPQVNKYNPLAS